MQMNAKIRTATPSDAPSACDVLRRSIMECCVDDHRNDQVILSAWLGNKTVETVVAWFSSGANHSVVATVDEAVVGVGLITRKGKIALCYVAPNLRFKGVGTLLLQAMESQAAVWQLSSVQVASTITAQDFYRRHGYTSQRNAESCFGTDTTLFSKSLISKSAAARPAQFGCKCASKA